MSTRLSYVASRPSAARATCCLCVQKCTRGEHKDVTMNTNSRRSITVIHFHTGCTRGVTSVLLACVASTARTGGTLCALVDIGLAATTKDLSKHFITAAMPKSSLVQFYLQYCTNVVRGFFSFFVCPFYESLVHLTHVQTLFQKCVSRWRIGDGRWSVHGHLNSRTTFRPGSTNRQPSSPEDSKNCRRRAAGTTCRASSLGMEPGTSTLPRQMTPPCL